MKKQVKKFVEEHSYFECDDSGDTWLQFVTRENGSVFAEVAGYKDLLEAKKLRDELQIRFGTSVEIETVDEWVILTVKFN